MTDEQRAIADRVVFGDETKSAVTRETGYNYKTVRAWVAKRLAELNDELPLHDHSRPAVPLQRIGNPEGALYRARLRIQELEEHISRLKIQHEAELDGERRAKETFKDALILLSRDHSSVGVAAMRRNGIGPQTGAAWPGAMEEPADRGPRLMDSGNHLAGQAPLESGVDEFAEVEERG
ncbi:hypothetical protein [Glycomyces sp. MUSA5-2]|uniref:hypothetical protein n=1 Tax=Glycomyces sp. MUSA5-2 TaxID=2053002 RepID=UPI00300944A2